jgi:hypothetical protein
MRSAFSSAGQLGNHPESSNINLCVHKRRGVREEASQDGILPMFVQMFLRFVALIREPQGGIVYRMV